MKHFYFTFLLVICLTSCNSHSTHWDTLSQVESYIEERPDSALVVLGQINTAELSDKAEKAKYAVLYTQAIDKNFIDERDLKLISEAGIGKNRLVLVKPRVIIVSLFNYPLINKHT